MTTTTKSTAQTNTQTRVSAPKGQGKQGFASMDRETVRKIAAKGGRASHSNQGHKESAKTEGKTSTSGANDSHGKQGFATMTKEEVQEAGRKGGEASHDSTQ